MNIIWIHNFLPYCMWQKNNLFGMSRLFLHPKMLKYKISFFVAVFHCGWDGYLCLSLIFIVWFKYNSAVVTEFGKYFGTSLDVNPVHDWKNSFSIASIHVDGTGLNAAACRYCIRSGSNEVWCTLLIYYYCGGVGVTLVWELSGIYHKSFLLSLGTWMTILTLHIIITSCNFNTALHPASHILPMETSEIYVRPVMIWP